MKEIISIDIGSTYTKGALFRLSGKGLSVVKTASVPTTPENLSSGFFAVIGKFSGDNVLDKGKYEFFFSSSAKGGLRIAAIGLVPELTLAAAKQAAFSAGARVSEVYSYKLCDEDLDSMRKNPPDIILFTGGTDGGAENYNLRNAEMLAKGRIGCPVIYAGNRCVASEIAKTLSNVELYVVGNVLPGLDSVNPGPAREKIREVFLKKITAGKGLDSIVGATSSEPLPTPYSMLEYLRKIYETRPDFGEFCAVDMGGATTDVYSCGGIGSGAANVIMKGLPEPEVKRSVEGDMGMRKSASAVFDSMNAEICESLGKAKLAVGDFEKYLAKIEMDSSALPETEEEGICERILAEACFSGSIRRHAGTDEETYTPQGKFFVRNGKDLRGMPKLIGSGGYLARIKDFSPMECMGTEKKAGKEFLMPRNPEYYVDGDYLFPLLANLSFKYPGAAVDTGIKVLRNSK